MSSFNLRSTLATVLPAIATTLLVQACSDPSLALAVSEATLDPYVGVWEAKVTVRDCTTGATLANFRGAQVIHHGGTLSDTNSSPAASRGPGWGTWARENENQYRIRFRFYRYAPDGSLAGSSVVTSVRQLSDDAQTYLGQTSAALFDANGREVATTCVTDEGRRLW